MKSAAKTVAAYLKSLPPERRKVISAVRAVIRKHLPKGYVETMDWGVIAYEIPLSRYPDTYNGRPLVYAGLAAQKGNYAVYLMCLYAEQGALLKGFKAAYEKAGKRLDMGKGCVRFRRLEDLMLPAVARVIAGTPVAAYIRQYEKSRKKKPS